MNAATPFELLGGKVLGVGGLGLVQYVAAFVPALVALAVPGPDREPSCSAGTPARWSCRRA